MANKKNVKISANDYFPSTFLISWLFLKVGEEFGINFKTVPFIQYLLSVGVSKPSPLKT
jgi:hypothetical protein